MIYLNQDWSDTKDHSLKYNSLHPHQERGTLFELELNQQPKDACGIAL